jgi:uncharacterized membrane protein
MSESIIEWLSLATTLGCGVVGGVFFAFSTFVMRALARSPAAEGMRAMQQINITVLNPWFLGAFLGTAAASLLLAGSSIFGRAGIDAAPLATASALYVLGTFGVTVACNVPRNEALARLDPEAPTSAEAWADYLRTWTFWNHIRTGAALFAMGILMAVR